VALSGAKCHKNLFPTIDREPRKELTRCEKLALSVKASTSINQLHVFFADEARQLRRNTDLLR